MSQIESAVFLTTLPPGILPRLFLMGVLITAPFSILAVLILGKGKADTADTELNTRLIMPTSEWAWQLTVIALAYLVLYFTFGYFIVWRNATARYYGGIDEGSFTAHMSAVLRDTFWLIPFQGPAGNVLDNNSLACYQNDERAVAGDRRDWIAVCCSDERSVAVTQPVHA